MALELASSSKRDRHVGERALPGDWRGFFIGEVRMARAYLEFIEGFCGDGLGGSRGSGGRYCYLQPPLLALRDFCGRSSPGRTLIRKNGAEYPTRTDDLPLTRRLLYQLS